MALALMLAVSWLADTNVVGTGLPLKKPPSLGEAGAINGKREGDAGRYVAGLKLVRVPGPE